MPLFYLLTAMKTQAQFKTQPPLTYYYEVISYTVITILA